MIAYISEYSLLHHCCFKLVWRSIIIQNKLSIFGLKLKALNTFYIFFLKLSSKTFQIFEHDRMFEKIRKILLKCRCQFWLEIWCLTNFRANLCWTESKYLRTREKLKIELSLQFTWQTAWEFFRNWKFLRVRAFQSFPNLPNVSSFYLSLKWSYTYTKCQ